MRALDGFEGDVHPVNARGASVEGRASFRRVTDLPTAVDLAVLAVPAEAVPEVVAECGTAGVSAAVICAGGFAETGDAARLDLQQRTKRAGASAGVRLLGPNTSGFYNPVDKANVTFLPGAGALPAGSLAVIAQSGGVNLALGFQCARSGLGLRLGVGLGNALDVGFAEVLDFVAGDEATQVVALHVEGAADGRALFEAVRRVAAVKPVVALKVGRSDVGAFAASHTGAMIGAYELTRAALAQAGAVVVDDPSELVDAARALTGVSVPAAADPGVGLVTAQAGPGLIVADMLRSAGVRLPMLAEVTRRRLDSLLPPITFLANPVDTGRPSETFVDVLGAVCDDPGVDVLACYVLDEPDAVDPADALASIKSDTPVVFGTAGIDSTSRRARFDPLDISVFESPDSLAHAARAVVARGRALHRMTTAHPTATCAARTINAAMDEHAAKQLLDQLGFTTPTRRVCAGPEAACATLTQLTTPVVVKVLDPAITHKTDVGGVAVGVRDERTMLAVLDDFTRRDLPVDRILVEEQAADGVDLIVGAVRDATFGPTVMLGIGGTLAEVVPPVAMRLAPMTGLDVAEMIEALPAELRAGTRGGVPVDASQLAEALGSLGAFLVAHPQVASIEINPLRAGEGGLIALDALVLVDGGLSGP